MIVYRDVVVNGKTTQTKIFDITECTYTGKDMGERSIVANIKWPSPIDFEIGDYVMLPMQSLVRSANGVDGSVLSGMDMERFYIYSMPTIKKNARPLSSGQAFEHTVTFYPAQYELGLIQMRDCGQEQANADTIIYTGFDSLSFVGGADELIRRIMAVLKEAYHDADGNPLWSYQIADAANENKNTALERVSFSFSGNSVMDALLKLNDKEGLNTSFFINGRTIYVGYKRPYFCRVTDGGSIDTNPDTQMFQFEYGKTSHQSIAINHGGLYQIIKTLGKETPITKLFAYGAARNLNRYYCSDRIKSGRYVNRVMLPSFDSDGKTDYILSEEGVKKYGIRESSKQFEEVYPSLRYMTYGDLRQIKYCIKVRYSGITNDKLEQGGSAYPVARVQCYKVVPSSKTTGINKLVEAAPPEDLCVIVHAMGKTVKVVLYGGNTDDEAIQKQRQHDSKVPTRTANGTDYIPGSCFLVHDRGFDTNKTYQNANRSAWFTNPNSFPTSLTDAQKTEINMNQIQYEDTFWLSDLYVFEGYGQMHFSRDGYSAWSWPRTNIDYMGGSADSTAVNEVVAAEPIVIEDTSSNVDDLTTQQKTFDLYLKDVGFQIDEQNDFGDMVFVVGSTLKISMLDGLMAGREFEAAGKVTDSQYTCICAYKEDGSLNDDFFMDSDYNKGRTIPQAALDAGAIWRVCCSRINLDEADYSNLNLILPTKDLCVKKGDHLVFLDIFMPDIYIHAAENRLLREARKYLEANDSGNVTYSAQFDKVRLQQIPNYALQMREGLNIRMVDDDLDISTENDGRYLSNYGENGLYSVIDVPYTRSAWEYVTTYKTATAHSGVTQEFIDKFGRAVSESGSTYMTVRIVLQYDETWIDRAPVQIIRSGTTYNLGVPKRVLSYGWSEIDGGYLYMLIFATPSGLNLSNSATIKRHQIKADSALKKSVWLSSNDVIDFTRGRFYTFKCSVKDTGYLAAANALALFSTKNDGIDGAKYLPTYTVQAEHKEKSGLLYLTFKFELPSNFNDDVVYYPSVLFNTDSRESSVGMWVESMYEKDFADGTNKLNYADFTIDSLTIKITDSSDGAPIREISATFAEHPAATTWATLMANIETVKIDGEQNVKAIETLVNTARKNYQTLLNLRNSIFDPDGTCDQAFLQVMMLQVGADSMNYQLDKTRTGLSANGQQVFHNCSCKKDGSGKWHFEVDAADTLRHFVYTQGGQGGTWDITNGIDVSLDGKSNYFVCVKCFREGNNGTWICSTKQYAVNDEEDTTAWFFNWGILTVDSAGNYTLVETRGNAYMYGDNLVCGKISTLAGNSYFDLTHGNFVLSDGTSKALSYENGILTIGGVNDESADSILARLGLTENVANNAQSTADSAKSVADAAKAAIDNLEVGGENLYTGDNPLTIAANNSNYNNQVFTCKLQNGEQYIFSCGKSVVKSGNTDKYTILLYDDTVTPNAGFGYWKLPVSATKVEKTFVVPNSGNWQIRLYAGEFHYTAGVSIEFTDIMVQKGNKATEYQKPIRKFLYNGNVSIPYKNTDYAQSKLLASGVYAGTYYTEMASESKGAGVTTANQDAFMNSCLVWFVAGKHQTTENVLKITDWGEAVNISQRADVYVYTGQAAFVKSHIKDPTSTGIEFTANGTWTISGAQISTYKMEYLEGETYEAKTKAEALDYLKAAIANGSTEVAGGLLMTNVLMLRDLANKVTAGLSGLTKYKPSGSSTTLEDLVLLWGGATYDEAFYAARNAGYLKKAGGDPITTLLKKDGTGKIGIFKISDTQAVIDVPNQGKVIIDASTANGGIFIKDSGGIDRVVISPLSLDSFGLASTHDLGTAIILKNINENHDEDLSGTVSYSKSFTAGKSGTLESSFSVITDISASVSIERGKGYPSATSGYNSLTVSIKDTTNGTTVFTQSLSALSVTASANNTTNTNNYADSKTDGKTYPVSIKIQVIKGHNYTLSISGTAIVRTNAGGTPSQTYEVIVQSRLSITSNKAIKLLYTDMCAYLCVDGMSVAANSELKFDVMKSGTDLKVLAQGLPTTTSGLSAGQIYKDSSGILRIWGG